MKNLIYLLFFLVQTSYTSAQTTVTDNFSWFTGVNTLITSPNFDFCDGDSISYTIETSSGTDISAYDGMTYTNPAWTAGVVGGIYIPGNYATNTNTSVNVVLTFSQPITDLNLFLVDLDAPANTTNQETITAINPPFQNTSSASTFFPTAATSGGYTSVVAQNPFTPFNKVDNSSGWVVWSNITPTNTFSFTFNRITGTALGIEGIEVFCDESTAGIENGEINKVEGLDVLISPNPGKGKYTITCMGANHSATKASVFSIEGRWIEDYNINNGTLELNLENQENGTYLLKFVSANGFTTVKTIIKQ